MTIYDNDNIERKCMALLYYGTLHVWFHSSPSLQIIATLF